jgi:predicted alpha/beta-fold hydrolase
LKPLLVIIPGIASDNDDPYLSNQFIEGVKQGYRVVMVNYRGGSGSLLTVS